MTRIETLSSWYDWAATVSCSGNDTKGSGTSVSHIIENGVEASRADFAESMPDEDDRVFYEVSLSNEDSFLVTGNLKHYPTSPRVITPAVFIDIISENK